MRWEQTQAGGSGPAAAPPTCRRAHRAAGEGSGSWCCWQGAQPPASAAPCPPPSAPAKIGAGTDPRCLPHQTGVPQSPRWAEASPQTPERRPGRRGHSWSQSSAGSCARGWAGGSAWVGEAEGLVCAVLPWCQQAWAHSPGLQPGDAERGADRTTHGGGRESQRARPWALRTLWESAQCEANIRRQRCDPRVDEGPRPRERTRKRLGLKPSGAWSGPR